MTRALLPILALLTAPASAAAADDAAPNPSASQLALHKALSVRHNSPSCDALSALSEAPGPDLLFLVEHAAQPPAVAPRAAECLLEQHLELALPAAQQWVVSPETRGLAILTMTKLDGLPRAEAVALAERALAGPLREDALKRVKASPVPEIAALADRPVESLPAVEAPAP